MVAIEACKICDALGRHVRKTGGGATRTSIYAGSNMHYFHHDAEAVVETYAYPPFGKPFVNEKVNTAPKSPLLFASRWYESEVGIYYYRARHYHPGLRRFLQPDPLGYEDGMNMYAYVQNNPMNYSDPMGLLLLHNG